jgi:hypothetical protein
MTKILNLDALSAKPSERELQIGGQSYPIPKMTVDNFIETTRAAARLEKSDDLAEQVEATIEMIQRAVPGVPRDALGGYSLEILGKIAAFVRGDDVDGAEEKLAQAQAAAAEQAGGDPTGK